MAIAFMFPGQGSQAVGMGKALAENFAAARAVFDEVDAALGQKLSDLMWDGPEADLTLTENAQPALMAVTMAVIRVLEAEHGITVANTAKFVAAIRWANIRPWPRPAPSRWPIRRACCSIRGKAMQAQRLSASAPWRPFSASILPRRAAVAAEAAQGDVCQAANDNSDGQVVISGHKAAVERALEIAKAKGAKRAIMLPVSRALPLRPDAARRRCDGGSLAEVTMNAPVGSGRRQCRRRTA